VAGGFPKLKACSSVTVLKAGLALPKSGAKVEGWTGVGVVVEWNLMKLLWVGGWVVVLKNGTTSSVGTSGWGGGVV